MDCGFLKTPEPMTVPTTTAVAVRGPRARTRPEVGAAGEGFMPASLRPGAAGRKRTAPPPAKCRRNKVSASTFPCGRPMPGLIRGAGPIFVEVALDYPAGRSTL